MKISATPIYQNPDPEFVWQMNLNKEVQFDASLSLKMERKVVRYEWEFGDGKKETTTSPNIIHQYSYLGNADVLLTVFDENGESSTATETVFIHDLKVSKPNDELNTTLLGIDSDNDGIRDDVERWIIRVSKDNSNVEKALNEIAVGLQLALTKQSDQEYLKEVNLLLEKRKQCLQYLLPEDTNELTYKMFLFQMFKTLERYKAWKNIRGDDDKTPRVIEYVEPIKYSQEDACE